ncbi:MAG: glycoside hydrolase family 127 protein [Oscillospiraceae bacterium]|nr:glycoside hydrolase family 127 protein [Oscillospiraceae bacterium]
MKNIGFSQVDITGGIMGRRYKTNAEATVFAVRDRFMETGRVDPYYSDESLRAENYPKNLHIFYDSDVVKLVEGAAYIVQKKSDPEVEALIKLVEEGVARNQGEDGYFNSWFQNNDQDKRWTNRDWHELYTAGHLIECAVAVYEATGRRTLLDCACRFADYIEKVFVTEKSAKFLTPGHEEIELALVRLYHATGNKKYLELAKYFVDARGNKEEIELAVKERGIPSSIQAHLPARKQFTAEGHAVRACYFYSAMADIAREYGDDELLTACKTIFEDIIKRKQYITGGVGQNHVGERFDHPYLLPNENAYNETCAGIAFVMFAKRMLELDTDSKYADAIELAIYNAILSGVSLDGKAFFYENPMEINLDKYKMDDWVDTNIEYEKMPRMQQFERQKVFACACCPPNVCRFFASIGGYAYGKDEGSYYIHQYFNGQMTDGDVNIKVETSYPAENTVKITAQNTKQVAVRIPGWCKKFSLDRRYTMHKGYAVIEGDGEINIEFDMPAVLMTAHYRVNSDVGRVALKRGPLVYCIEAMDNGGELRSLYVSSKLNAEISYNKELDAYTIETDGFRIEDSDKLYRTIDDQPKFTPTRIKYIPYFTFANRGVTSMEVWVKLKRGE